MDCFSGEIVALEMRDNMKKELCIDTVRQLERIYPNLKGAVLHSDRGSQYTSAAFRAELSRRGMVQSLSGTGHCFDNARMESFFATLKKEKIYQIAAYKLPREQVKTIIFRYIFIYYNRVRVYTRNPLGLPPVKYREWVRACRRWQTAWQSTASVTASAPCRSLWLAPTMGRSVFYTVSVEPERQHFCFKCFPNCP